jgi:3-deoxy-7-phosphoheptulonate synthase
VDCSHMNAGQDHRNEGNVFRNVLEQRVGGNAGVVGVMLESHLNPGNQALGNDPSELAHGVSITDACIGWEKTEQLLLSAAKRLRS